MTLKFLTSGFYENPNTGSLAPAEEWENDFFNSLSYKPFLEQLSEDTDKTLNELTIEDIWEYWGGSSLIEVEKNEEGDWVKK